MLRFLLNIFSFKRSVTQVWL